MLELETLGPLLTLKPGAEVSYEERWELHNGVELEFTEGSIKANLPSLVDKP